MLPADIGLNVLLDLINFASEIDAVAISGKGVRKGKPMSLSQMKPGVR